MLLAALTVSSRAQLAERDGEPFGISIGSRGNIPRDLFVFHPRDGGDLGRIRHNGRGAPPNEDVIELVLGEVRTDVRAIHEAERELEGTGEAELFE
jgi:hypothetical protein